MSNRDMIAEVLTHALSASRLTQVRNIATAHENCWKEYLNGSNSSQLAAAKKLEEVVKQAMAELEETSVQYIMSAIKK